MSDRMLRVNSTIREVLADEIERLSDSRLNMVSVTGVDTSPDLRRATVFVDVLGEEDRENALRALRGAAKRLQGVLGAQLRTKYTPTLEFAIDPGVAGGDRIEAILRELRTSIDTEEE
jgi:ribosome-binding factor A